MGENQAACWEELTRHLLSWLSLHCKAGNWSEDTCLCSIGVEAGDGSWLLLLRTAGPLGSLQPWQQVAKVAWVGGLGVGHVAGSKDLD